MLQLFTRKIKPLTLTLLILVSATMTFLSLSNVKAETQIISLTPSSGYVGTTVQIIANLTTENGQYRLKFDQIELPSGNAVGNKVNASFSVPHKPQGSYNVTIIDVKTGESSTTTFTVLTSYSFKPLLPQPPLQIQQGENVAISVNITGGKANYNYPKIKVQTPTAVIYEAPNINITTNDIGDFSGSVIYPTDFANGANTNFTGEYKIIFNENVVGTFFIGLTDRSEYHRGDLVKIKAVDYLTYNNKNVTITIKFGNQTIAAFNCTVIDGIVNANWTVPNTTFIGNYVLSITPVPASKQNATDTQKFTIPGFKIEMFPRNLANEVVPDVLVKVYDKAVNKTYDAESDENGVASILLERGDYNCTAYFKEVRVGTFTFNITESAKLDFQCQLTNLEIIVVDAQNINVQIPFVSISLAYNYVTDLNGGENKTEPAKLYQTNITGTLQMHSMLLNAVYKVNASRYGENFNKNNNTFSNLQPQAWNKIAIPCPAKSLRVNVVDAKSQPIADAIIEAQEVMGGLQYSGSTNQNGQALLNCIFGIYSVKVYHDGLLLNETEVNLFDHQNLTLKCSCYNLPISIKVVDYFGQPIPNANVTLERNSVMLSSKLTGTNGMAGFTEIGGMLTIKVYFSGQNQPVTALTTFIGEERNETNPVEVKIGRYVFLAGFLIETAQFAAMILILAVIIVMLAMEIYRIKRFKPIKT
ncbi:MAG: carboxypeptidase-like regulatory domain-containing protein [Candidatus Bathyarchaeales archaeon]